MATWKESPNWTPFDDINGGQQFSNMLSPEDLNALAENIAYLYENQGENEYLGEYTGGSYRVGAIVKYSDGNIYMCIKDTDDEQEPTDTEYWEMLNEEGGGETVETWDGTGVVIAPIEEEPTTEDALAGTWVFNDTLTDDILNRFEVSFSSDGVLYSSISGYPEVQKPRHVYLVYGGTDTITVYDNAWLSSVNKTITITSNLSDVTNGSTLLAWLQANATKQ